MTERTAGFPGRPSGHSDGMSSVKDARKALGRGDLDEALVVLWNEFEPARLAGDRRRLRAIEGLATRVAQEGDEGQRRDAERLLEMLARAPDDEGASVPSIAEVEAEPAPLGEEHEHPLEPEELEHPLEDEAEGERKGRFSIGPIVWLLILLAFLVLNALNGLRD